MTDRSEVLTFIVRCGSAGHLRELVKNAKARLKFTKRRPYKKTEKARGAAPSVPKESALRSTALFVAILTSSVMIGTRPALAGCSSQAHGEHTSLNWRELAWIDKGKEAIKEKLKDGESARFKNVYFCRSHDIPMTCG